MSRNNIFRGVSNLDFLKMLITMGVTMNTNADNQNVIIITFRNEEGIRVKQYKITKIEDKSVDVEITGSSDNEVIGIIRNVPLYCSFDVLKQIMDSMSSYPAFQDEFLANVDTEHEGYQSLVSGMTFVVVSLDQENISVNFNHEKTESCTITFNTDGVTQRYIHSGSEYSANVEYEDPFNFTKLCEICNYCGDDNKLIYLLCRTILNTCTKQPK